MSRPETKGKSVAGQFARQVAGQTVEQTVICDLCPRECHIANGKNGYCFVRQNHDGTLIAAAYGRSTGFCIDPVEKKPLYHFLPGTPTLSFGTVGCNLGCLHCQNWQTSHCRSLVPLTEHAMPETIADAARQLECPSVSFTYNEPVVWAEYAVDTAKACRERGVKTVVVSAGYIMPEPRKWFFEQIDAANIDLKAFSERFYQEISGVSLQPVLDTLRYVARETDVWLEVTTLLIPGKNDDPEELRRMCDWFVHELGEHVPLHFSAFHPAHKLQEIMPTSPDSLFLVREFARKAGIRHVYPGNVSFVREQSTFCPQCGQCVLERNDLGTFARQITLPENTDQSTAARSTANGVTASTAKANCRNCGTLIPGVFQPVVGNWGNRRQGVRFS
ncbi:MAG: AmmeMemoRadiSam system radical SAM enzyme [Planctomycetaceae bacterium]|nr:AmmeMemoRadiSam system radical SAM enzyme [Planctomycetaceae bacterium]